MDKRKYTVLTKEERINAFKVMGDFLHTHPNATFKQLLEHGQVESGLGQKLTYGCAKGILKRMKKFKRSYKHTKKRRRSRAVEVPLNVSTQPMASCPKTSTDSSGQHEWQWGTKTEGPSIGTLSITYAGESDTHKYAIQLLEMALGMLKQGEKNA